MKILFISFILFVFSQTLNAQEGWYYQNPIPTSAELTKVQFVTEYTGWAIGSSGTIIHTSNGGDSWDLQIIDSLFSIDDLFFVDEKNGWGVGSKLITRIYGWPFTKDIILTTNDGGINWNSEPIKYIANEYAYGTYSIFFSDQSTGWIASYSGLILKTTDGGVNWMIKDTLNSQIKDIYFINDQIGWAVGNAPGKAAIFKTNDGGDNWIMQNSTTNGTLESVFFINRDIGYTVGRDNIILKTENGGDNWIKQSAGQNLTNKQLTSVYFTDTDHGYIAGWGIFLTTTNGGQNWEIQENIDPTPLSVFFINSSIGWRVGIGGAIEKTVNGGATWDFQSKRFTWDSFQRVDFTDKKDGWVVSNESIYRTFDGGESWLLQKSIPTQGITNMFAVDNLNCWIIGYNWESTSAFILHTTDGGTQWSNQPIQFKSDLNDVYFVNKNMGWVIGDSGAVFSTVDGGQNWVRQETGTLERFISVDFINSYQGWIISLEGKIFYTSTGGNDWSLLPQEDLLNVREIEFIDSLNGWSVGGYQVPLNYSSIIRGYIYNTTDGGKTWLLQFEDSVDVYSSIKFINKSIGWVSGSGTILYTIDGGKNWKSQLLPEIGQSSLDFVDMNNGWLVGAGGIIMHTKSGGTTFIDGSDRFLVPIPSNFSLMQNYPNPFNPTTTIKYQLPKLSQVELSIYNILGQKVATLVSEKQAVGSYKAEWDATTFASGVYFYKLETDQGFAQTRKLIVLK